MLEETARVEEIQPLGDDCIFIRLKAPSIASQSRPGQFVMVKVQEGYDPLLKRPLGILDSGKESISLYFQIRGRGTEILGAKHRGDSIRILGPLGKEFPRIPGARTLLLAGGRGIVPIYSYCRRFSSQDPLALAYGARFRGDLHFLDEIRQMPLRELHLYTEDGSLGNRGLVTDSIPDLVKCLSIELVFACGPEGMLAALSRSMPPLKHGFFVSLESLMGCGFGICHSCVIPLRNGGYARVCEEGPVFAAEEIRWPI